MEIIEEIKKTVEVEASIVKRIPLKAETYKFLKKMAIDLELDGDGAIKPDMIGACIDKLVKDTQQA